MSFTSVASFAYDTIKYGLEKTLLHIPSIKACILYLVHLDITGMRENSFFELHFEVNKLMILSEILADWGGGA